MLLVRRGQVSLLDHFLESVLPMGIDCDHPIWPSQWNVQGKRFLTPWQSVMEEKINMSQIWNWSRLSTISLIESLIFQWYQGLLLGVLLLLLVLDILLSNKYIDIWISDDLIRFSSGCFAHLECFKNNTYW